MYHFLLLWLQNLENVFGEAKKQSTQVQVSKRKLFGRRQLSDECKASPCV